MPRFLLHSISPGRNALGRQVAPRVDTVKSRTLGAAVPERTGKPPSGQHVERTRRGLANRTRDGLPANQGIPARSSSCRAGHRCAAGAASVTTCGGLSPPPPQRSATVGADPVGDVRRTGDATVLGPRPAAETVRGRVYPESPRQGRDRRRVLPRPGGWVPSARGLVATGPGWCKNAPSRAVTFKRDPWLRPSSSPSPISVSPLPRASSSNGARTSATRSPRRHPPRRDDRQGRRRDPSPVDGVIARIVAEAGAR